MITDEILFYGGIAVTAMAVMGTIIFFVIFYIGKIKLNAAFDKEYGEELKLKRRKKV